MLLVVLCSWRVRGARPCSSAARLTRSRWKLATCRFVVWRTEVMLEGGDPFYSSIPVFWGPVNSGAFALVGQTSEPKETGSSW